MYNPWKLTVTFVAILSVVLIVYVVGLKWLY
nr:MAG TPA: hypothetical protein [Caudoviricetes sp.]